MKTRIVNIILSKRLRVVVVCQRCPISPAKFGLHQKSACMSLEHTKNNGELARKQVCDYYEMGSVRRIDDVIVVNCKYV